MNQRKENSGTKPWRDKHKYNTVVSQIWIELWNLFSLGRKIQSFL